VSKRLKLSLEVYECKPLVPGRHRRAAGGAQPGGADGHHGGHHGARVAGMLNPLLLRASL
jgi:hypothetical protein